MPIYRSNSARGVALADSFSSQLITFLSVLFLVVLVRTAWLADDAYITFRTVDNFVHGYGMRWNVAERVQSFTHPLWFLMFSAVYALTREAYFTAYAATIGLSLLAFVIFLRRVPASPGTALVAGATLLMAKSFVDYSTSGLENPLSHLLMVLFLLAWWDVGEEPRGLTWLWLMGGLLALNRLDLALLIAPALTVASWPFPWRVRLRSAAIGLTPLIVWELFSIVYYGFPLPNTAYAKLQHGLSSGSMFLQGFLYLLDEFAVDPVTPVAIGVSAALVLAIGPRRDWPFLLGFALYMFYVLRVGGDFMTGRFFSVAVLMFVAIWARHPWRLPRGAVPLALGLLGLLGVFGSSRPTLTSSSWTFTVSPNDAMSVSGVADERAFYYRYTGLLRWSRARTLPWNSQVERGLALKAAPSIAREVNIGFMGYFAGPKVTIIDEYGLCDPFLARLPATNADWRTGHYYRPSPPGYIESVETGTNKLIDPEQALLYERIRTITRDPLWAARRWRAILDLAFS